MDESRNSEDEHHRDKSIPAAAQFVNVFVDVRVQPVMDYHCKEIFKINFSNQFEDEKQKRHLIGVIVLIEKFITVPGSVVGSVSRTVPPILFIIGNRYHFIGWRTCK